MNTFVFVFIISEAWIDATELLPTTQLYQASAVADERARCHDKGLDRTIQAAHHDDHHPYSLRSSSSPSPAASNASARTASSRFQRVVRPLQCPTLPTPTPCIAPLAQAVVTSTSSTLVAPSTTAVLH
ncbi:hypothetical protein ACLOJK_029129 [Asimina triloba]